MKNSITSITGICVLAAVVATLLTGCEPKYHKPIRVGAYNIQYSRGGGVENPWPERNLITRNIMEDMDLDIMGSQEPYLEQINDMMEYLGDRYAWIGIDVKGGKDTKGVHYNPIFYKKDRFEVLDQGVFWLSDTPETPSKFDDSYSLRMCYWAHFRDKTTGVDFFHFNNHFDHRGVNARLQSSHLITRKVAEIAGDRPAFLTGDFNSDQHTEAYRNIAGSGILVDSFHAAETRINEEWQSYNGYKYSETPRENATRIDHLFVTPHGGKVLSWELCNYAYEGKYPSDHHPIVIEWCLAK